LGNYVTQYRLDSLKDGLARVEGKQEFLIRYLRYMIDREKLRTEDTLQNREKFEQAEKMLVDLLKAWWVRQQDASTQLPYVHIVKESLDPAASHIKFADGSEWPIPREVKELVLAGGH
jgi:hypothetical protein